MYCLGHKFEIGYENILGMINTKIRTVLTSEQEESGTETGRHHNSFLIKKINLKQIAQNIKLNLMGCIQAFLILFFHALICLKYTLLDSLNQTTFENI